jgi:hypothetical protein
MSRLHRIVSLAPSDYLLLIHSLLLVIGFRVGLWLLPFRWLQGFTLRVLAMPASSRSAPTETPAERISWAVNRASRLVPAATCLTQALATQVLLSRHGISARLHVGVAKRKGERLRAHAWVEADDQIVIGRSEVEQFTVLMTLDGNRRSWLTGGGKDSTTPV